jgi:hypothetical protein
MKADRFDDRPGRLRTGSACPREVRRDAHGLGLPEGGFDVVIMHTLVSHVADPASVLAEGRGGCSGRARGG